MTIQQACDELRGMFRHNPDFIRKIVPERRYIMVHVAKEAIGHLKSFRFSGYPVIFREAHQ